MQARRLCSPHCCIPPHSRPVPPAALPQMLNAAGYGRPGSGLMLDLVYNPGGVFLAPPQSTLEPVYKQVRGWSALGGSLGGRRWLAGGRRPSAVAHASTTRTFVATSSTPTPALPACLPCPWPPCRSWRSTLASPSTPCSASTTCPSSAGQTTWHGSESHAGASLAGRWWAGCMECAGSGLGLGWIDPLSNSHAALCLLGCALG